jgi:hypothetical protein
MEKTAGEYQRRRQPARVFIGRPGIRSGLSVAPASR